MGDQWVDLPLPLGNDISFSTQASDAQLVGFMLRKNEIGAQRQVSIIPSPGLTSKITTGSGDMRGMIVHGSYAWYVRGTQLYRISGGVATLINTVAGTYPVQMVGAGVNQIFVVDGDGNEYVATAGAVTAVAPPAGNFSDCTYMDGYTICIRDGTDEFYISNLDDPTTFGALNFSTADAVSDVLVACYVHNRELFLVGKKHTEVWVNTGAASFPFTRASPGVIDIGTVYPGSMAHLGTTLFFVGTDQCVYRLDGYTPVKISTPYIELAIKGMGADARYMRASAYSDEGQSFYAISVDITGTTGVYVYGIQEGVWHSRTHGGGSAGAYVDVARYSAAATYSLVYAAIRSNLGSLVTGIYSLDPAAINDDTSIAQSRFIVLPQFEAGGRRVFEHELEVRAQPSANAGSVTLSFRDSPSAGYSNHSTITAGSGRIAFPRCGSFIQRSHKLVFVLSDGLEIDAIRARIEVGL